MAVPIRRIGEVCFIRKKMDAGRVPGWGALTRMTRIHRMFSWLRSLWTSVAATVVGVVNVTTRPIESTVELKPGDRAPEFALAGSDGRTYRLSDFKGRAVVIAWFPKAFTGG